MKRFLRVAAFALAACLTLPAGAVTTRSWRLTDPAEMARGAADGLVIGPGGSLTLAPRLTPLALASRGDTEQPILWCLAQDARTQTLYAGTGDEGRVLRIGSDGAVEILAELPEPHVTSLALLPSGRVIAATSPEGAVYSIDSDGATEVLLEPSELYIWSLAVGRDGSVYAGTGERGRIYKVDANGDGTLFYDGEDAHIVSLAWDRQGRLLAGTSGHGLLLRLDETGHATVLLDADQSEISSIAVDVTGSVFASAFPSRAPREAKARPLRLRIEGGAAGQAPTSLRDGGPLTPPEADGPLHSEDEPLLAFVEEGTAAFHADGREEPTSPAPGGNRSVLYRVSGTSPAEEIWSSESEKVFALAAGADGSLWMGSGSPGKILRLEGPGQVATVQQLPEGQVTALTIDRRGGLLAATGNGGSIYGLGPARSVSGVFTSAPLDAGQTSSWGRLEWEAGMPSGARIEIQTRSGAGPVPDASWSGWSEACAPSVCVITSPPGRSLQWRAKLTGGGKEGADPPVLRSATLSSLPANRAPRVGVVTVPLPGIGADTAVRPGSAGGDNPAAPPSGVTASIAGETRPQVHRLRRHVVVTAEDPDRDPLSWTLSARPASTSASTTPVEVPSEGDAPDLTWDDSALPEGRWILVVRASDERANAPGTEQTASSESPPFEVDRTPPVLTPFTGPRGELRIRAADAISPLVRAEYSFDGATWRAVAVADGILDSREEELLAPPGSALRSVWFSVRDAAGNEARIQAPAPGR